MRITAPFQISFTNDFAYVNHIGTADVSMIQLAAIGRKVSPLSVVPVPGGQQALGTTSMNSPAARVVHASGSIDFTPPQPRVYYGHIQCSSVNLQFGNPNYITVRSYREKWLKREKRTPVMNDAARPIPIIVVY
jgi:hypothetical protein